VAPLSLERRDSIFALQLGDGENRFDRRLLDELERALDEVEQSGEPAALITVGSGRFYSNGYDLDWLAEQGPDARRVFIRDYQLLLARLLVFPMPTVAAISGHAFGAAALLALHTTGGWRARTVATSVCGSSGPPARKSAPLSERGSASSSPGSRRAAAPDWRACDDCQVPL
jgi:hypothetical protein